MPLQLNWQSKRGPRGGTPNEVGLLGALALRAAVELLMEGSAAFRSSSSMAGGHAVAGVGF
jgi:hypothetical protein